MNVKVNVNGSHFYQKWPTETKAEAAAERGPTELAGGKGGLDLGEVGEFERGGGLFGVLDDAGLVDDEGGAGAHGAQADQVGQQGAVLLADFLI